MKKDQSFTISGKVINLNTNQGISGLLVEAWDKDLIFHDFLGSTTTDSNGNFRLIFNSNHFREAFLDNLPDLFFRIMDGTVLLKNSIHDVHCNLKAGNHNINFYIDYSKVDDKPPLKVNTLTGPLIEAETLFEFKRSLSIILTQLGSKYPVNAIKALRIPFEGMSNLMDLASASISGNQQKTQQFRELLWSFGGKVAPSQLGLRVLRQFNSNEYVGEKSVDRKKKKIGFSFPQGNKPYLINLFRLERLMLATSISARDSKELATLAASLEHAILGADQLNTLNRLILDRANPSEIANAFDTAVRISSFSFPPYDGFSPFEEQQHGFWPGPNFGVPWFEWPLPNPENPVPGNPSPGVPVPEIPRFDGGLIDHFEECFIHNIIPELHRTGIGFRGFVFGVGTNYVIESVSPDHSCPGATITILGERFDGAVAVRYYDKMGRTISTTPETASSTQITFILAEDAVSGPIWLYIPRTVRVCLSEHTVAVPGTRGELVVGEPHIMSFSTARECFPIGEAIELSWRVTPSDVSVDLTHHYRGIASPLGIGLGSIDRISVTPTFTGTHEFELIATNPSATSCNTTSSTISIEVRDPAPPPFEIIGVEKTQAIQVYDLSNPDDTENNSLELISGMDTILRVYVRALSSVSTRVTGSVELNGTTYAPVNEDTSGPNPIITASTSPDRANVNDSLNFLIPAADANGLDITAHIRLISATTPCVNPIVNRAETLSWIEKTPFPVTVRIIANSDGTQIARGAATSFINRTFFKIPSPKTAIVIHPGVHQIRRGTAEDNYCDDGGFYQLALSIAYEHNDNEGYPPASHSSSWIGLVTPDDCTPDGMMAWPSTSTCLSVQNETTAAHEIMHTAGLGHTITGAGEGCWEGPAHTGGADTQPVACHRLEGRPLGALDQVPFDIDNNELVSNSFDLMSYRGFNSRWLSPELWVEGRRLMDSRY